MAVAADGSIFVGEPETAQVKRFTPQGGYVGAVLLNKTNTVDGFHLAADSTLNLLAITDPGVGRVAFYRLDLTPLGSVDGLPNAPGPLQVPSGITIAQNRVYVAEAKQGRILAYDVAELKP